jgi:hypothetical protein
VEKLEDEVAYSDLDKRCNRRMPKIAVGFPRHAGKILIGDCLSDKRPHHLDGDLGIGPTSKAGNRAGLELGPTRRHVKAAVAGEPRKHRFYEAERRGLTPG